MEGGRRDSCRVRQDDDKKSIFSAVGLLKEIKRIFLLGRAPTCGRFTRSSPGNGLWPPHFDHQMAPAPQAMGRGELVRSLWVPSTDLALCEPRCCGCLCPSSMKLGLQETTYFNGVPFLMPGRERVIDSDLGIDQHCPPASLLEVFDSRRCTAPPPRAGLWSG